MCVLERLPLGRTMEAFEFLPSSKIRLHLVQALRTCDAQVAGRMKAEAEAERLEKVKEDLE